MKTTDRTAVMVGLDVHRRFSTVTGRNAEGKVVWRQQNTVLPIVKRELRAPARRRWDRARSNDPWVLLAVDGSKENLTRTGDHERVFGIADNGWCPQAFITAIAEVHTGLLWDWRLDRARASEKHHLLDMIPDLPDDALLLADAGFVGLPIWEKLNTEGKHFLIRVGGNVHLLKDLWPKTKAGGATSSTPGQRTPTKPALR